MRRREDSRDSQSKRHTQESILLLSFLLPHDCLFSNEFYFIKVDGAWKSHLCTTDWFGSWAAKKRVKVKERDQRDALSFLCLFFCSSVRCSLSFSFIRIYTRCAVGWKDSQVSFSWLCTLTRGVRHVNGCDCDAVEGLREEMPVNSRVAFCSCECVNTKVSIASLFTLQLNHWRSRGYVTSHGIEKDWEWSSSHVTWLFGCLCATLTSRTANARSCL